MTNGSSPLARGTRDRLHPDLPARRFIPARAGNTPSRRAIRTTPTVHPRSRGEHCNPPYGRAQRAGSSPLARGTLRRRHGGLPVRFIPARAGNTATTGSRRHPSTVHPRSRGEHGARGERIYGYRGSSPLARGTQAAHGRRLRTARFIPARAGNTGADVAADVISAVHPRSRGEHVERQHRTRWSRGSSPLARGTPPLDVRGRRRRRFIPARAGNTSSPRSSVHPRSRGEHSRRNGHSVSLAGSSPLARGTRPPGAREIAG